jgi:hypothetical protein
VAAGEPEAHDLGRDHVERLSEHHRLGLDPPHAPAHDPQAVDHRGVRVRAHQSVREGQGGPILLARQDALGQELQVHLVDDPSCRGHHAEVREGLLPPAQELVALTVPLELDLGVLLQGVRGGEDIHLDGVVDHQIHWDERTDLPGISPQVLDRGPHGRQVHHGRDAGEILQDHPGRHVRKLHVGRRRGMPSRQIPDVGIGDQLAVYRSQHRLEKDLDREGHAVDAGGEAGLLQGVQAVNRGRAVSSLEGAAGAENVGFHGFPPVIRSTTAPRMPTPILTVGEQGWPREILARQPKESRNYDSPAGPGEQAGSIICGPSRTTSPCRAASHLAFLTPFPDQWITGGDGISCRGEARVSDRPAGHQVLNYLKGKACILAWSGIALAW